MPQAEAAKPREIHAGSALTCREKLAKPISETRESLNIFAAYFYERISKRVGADRAGSHFIGVREVDRCEDVLGLACDATAVRWA